MKNCNCTTSHEWYCDNCKEVYIGLPRIEGKCYSSRLSCPNCKHIIRPSSLMQRKVEKELEEANVQAEMYLSRIEGLERQLNLAIKQTSDEKLKGIHSAATTNYLLNKFEANHLSKIYAKDSLTQVNDYIEEQIEVFSYKFLEVGGGIAWSRQSLKAFADGFMKELRK